MLATSGSLAVVLPRLPSCRRAEQMASTGGDELEAVSTVPLTHTVSHPHTHLCTRTSSTSILILLLLPHSPGASVSIHSSAQCQHSQPAPCNTPKPCSAPQALLHPPPKHKPPQVKTYFNNDGFNRWKKIYGETDEVNKVQLDIRQGHAQTVDKVLNWLQEEGGLKGTTICDAGCGTGAAVGWRAVAKQRLKSRQPTQGGCFCGCDVQGSCEAFGVQMLTQCMSCRAVRLLVLLVPCHRQPGHPPGPEGCLSVCL